MNPEVSVIMSTYNEKEEFVQLAIESVLNQTFSNYEFLIVLDNPDNKLISKCVEKYAQQDKRIKIIRNKTNIGLTNSLNKALKISKGVYMSRLDADDIMDQGCLEEELRILKKEKLDLVSASKINISEDGSRKYAQYINSFSPLQMKLLMPYDNSINHSTVLVKIDKIRKLNYYREIPSCEDYDLWVRLLCTGSKMRIIPNTFLQYRIRENSVCQSNAYQMYSSKRFVMNMARQYKKNPDVIYDDKAYEVYIKKININSQNQIKFNYAYTQMYKSFECMRAKQYLRFCKYYMRAVSTDSKMLWILASKIGYQLRKKIVLKITEKRKI